ncbi:MAG: molecular chaperone DnaJ [Rhodospirillaceae bacterium]|nr:molecular chaperone DnaJ [Rhodospirillaceae bacterium]
MAKQDYYETLGVARDTQTDAIKKAYRKLAMQFHPDRNPGDAKAEQKFKEINEAYDVLKDEQKRAAYDRFGHAAFDGAAAGAGGFRQGGFGAGGFADIFDEMFGDFVGQRRGGGAGAGQGGQRGADLRFNMRITLEEAFTGRAATIRVPSSAICEDCSGSGAEKGTDPVTCTLCQGRGRVRQSQGLFTFERTCPQCNGGGRIIEKPCKTCSGAGRVRREKTLNVNVPPGVEEGTRIRLAGEGEAGMRGAPPGDLYIFLDVAPHALFERDGADLHCQAVIPMMQAALGDSIELPSIDGGKARISIPAGAQSGQRLRLKGKGMSVLRSTARGDLYVELLVETPVNLTKKQQEIMQSFKEAGGADKKHSPKAQSFRERLKSIRTEAKE